MRLSFQILIIAILLAAQGAGAEPPIGSDSKVAQSIQLADVEKELLNPSSSTLPKKISLFDAPDAVQRTVRQHAGGRGVTVTRQIENGRVVFDASFDKEGLANKIKVAEDGTLMARDELQLESPAGAPDVTSGRLKLWELPALVQETIRREVGEVSAIRRLDKQARGDDMVYRATFRKQGVPVEIVVAQNGTLISQSAAAQIREASGAKRDALRLHELPEPARKTIQAQLGSSQIHRVEKVQRGSSQFYKITFGDNGAERTLMVSEDGKVLQQ